MFCYILFGLMIFSFYYYRFITYCFLFSNPLINYYRRHCSFLLLMPSMFRSEYLNYQNYIHSSSASCVLRNLLHFSLSKLLIFVIDLNIETCKHTTSKFGLPPNYPYLNNFPVSLCFILSPFNNLIPLKKAHFLLFSIRQTKMRQFHLC
jgi:hypothetical protein